MYSLSEVARVHTTLVPTDVDHLQRLVANWGLLADLSFTDLLLFAATDAGSPRQYVVLAQVRPTTSQTLYRADLVGTLVPGAEGPLVDRCYRSGEATGADEVVQGEDVPHSVRAVPVRHGGRVIGVLISEGLPSGGRRHGELETAYLNAFGHLARMVAVGEFPVPGTEDPLKELPRVGDGVILLDADGRVQYSSPNAVSALHRLGVVIQVEGATFGQLGLDEGVVRTSIGQRRPATMELSRGTHTNVLVHAVPLPVMTYPFVGVSAATGPVELLTSAASAVPTPVPRPVMEPTAGVMVTLLAAVTRPLALRVMDGAAVALP